MNAFERTLTGQGGASCLNCGAALTGAFCASCGQKARVNRSLAAFFSDLVAGLFNFESRFWRTLPMLAWCPGDLTRRYVEGQRARFISPIALYLFSVFLMFAALSATTGSTGGTAGPIRINGDVDRSIAKTKTNIENLEKQRQAAAQAGTATASLDRKISGEKEDLARLEGYKRDGISGSITTNSEGAPPWLVKVIRKVESNPREAMSHVQEAASKYSWALIPLSLPFMFLLFPLRPKHVFDHAVFVTYSLSFMMLLILSGSLLVMAGMGGWVALLALLVPVHMYRQLKGAYRLRWWSAALRTFVLLNFASLALGLFGVIVAALGLID
ncbi:DUF3667 domain-containing protein [Sphingomonas rosea]